MDWAHKDREVKGMLTLNTPLWFDQTRLVGHLACMLEEQ